MRPLNLTYLDDGVQLELHPVIHIVGEHLDDFLQVELSSPAEPEQERINVPWVLSYVISFYPLLKLLKDLFLLFRHVSQVAVDPQRSRL